MSAFFIEWGIISVYLRRRRTYFYTCLALLFIISLLVNVGL